MIDALVPCSECGTDLFERDCDERTVTVEIEMERELFGQTTEERELPAWVCPECGHVQAL